jgi:phosphate:Na+ symporter
MIGFIAPMAKLVTKMIPERIPPERPIEEPKFLNQEALTYPETALAALEQETQYLFEHAVFEIVAHALSMHRSDILSEAKPKKVVHKSREDLRADVRELYLTKVKRIYSEIIAFAVHAQSDLSLSETQHQRISELKTANRKIVEVIRHSNELSRNVNHYLRESHPVMINQYDKFRKKLIKVFRVIQGYRQDSNGDTYRLKLAKLSGEAIESSKMGNLEIDQLIRKNKITPEMASSLVNDHDHLNDMIQNLIEIATTLYGGKENDTLPLNPLP